MKWNGPHDEEFFRCFAAYLDEAIKKFVQSQKISDVKTDELDPVSNDSGLQPGAFPGSAGKNFKLLEVTEAKDDTGKTDSTPDLKNTASQIHESRYDSLNLSRKDSRGTRSSS